MVGRGGCTADMHGRQVAALAEQRVCCMTEQEKIPVLVQYVCDQQNVVGIK